MTKSVIIAFLAILPIFAMAQPKELRIEIEEIFTAYQNSYNNSTQAYKMLEKGYKKSASVVDAKYYFGSALKFSKAAQKYINNAVEASDRLMAERNKFNCDPSPDTGGKMKSAFQNAGASFNKAEEILAVAYESDNINEMASYLNDSIQQLQTGVKKLNLAVDHMNTLSTESTNCK